MKAGDVVRLKSYGPMMVVQEIRTPRWWSRKPEIAVCAYHRPDYDDIKVVSFAVAALESDD